MISHEWEPPTPTKREMIECDIQERLTRITELEETIANAQEGIDMYKNDLDDLRDMLRRLDPDPDSGRDDVPDTKGERG